MVTLTVPLGAARPLSACQAGVPEAMNGRCEVCKEPLTPPASGSEFCATCAGFMVAYDCTRCGVRCRSLKPRRENDLCQDCLIRTKLAALSPAGREALRAAIATGSRLAAVVAFRRILDVRLSDASWAVEQFEV